MLEILARQREYFNSNQTLNLHFRREQLKNLRKVILEKKEDLYAAFKEDLNKCEYDVVTTELGMAIQELDYLIKNLYRLADDRVSGASLVNYPAKCFEVFEPYGNVLVVAPWNYPFQLTMVPVFGAIAGGNTVVVKPSRNTPNVTKVIKDILEIFPDEYVYVVDKDEEIEELFDNRFDFIFYTGSGKVGRELMAKQAQYLTPMTLELGGKNPCIVSKSANLTFAAKRIAWGKFLNAGQTCVAPDYILVDRKVKEQFLKKLEIEINKFYYKEGQLTSDFVKIINQKAFDRLFHLLDPSKVVIGGRTRGLIMEPTVMDNVTFNDEIMEDEIFGPLLPIIEYDTIDEVVEKLRTLPKPLALYYFGKKQKEGARVLKQCPSGGGCINDVVMHVTERNLPFGGVGESGFGTYHGAETFYAFVHKKSVLKKSSWFDMEKKYPPYDEKKLAFAKKIFGIKEPKEKNKEEQTEQTQIENKDAVATENVEVQEETVATENVEVQDATVENEMSSDIAEEVAVAMDNMPEDIDAVAQEDTDERPVLLNAEESTVDADINAIATGTEEEFDSVATEEENAEIARMEAEIAKLENEFEESENEEDFDAEETDDLDVEETDNFDDDTDDAGEQADTLEGQETMNEIVPEPIIMNLEEPENGEEIFDEISQSVLSEINEIDDIDAEPADMPSDEETVVAPVETPVIEDVATPAEQPVYEPEIQPTFVAEEPMDIPPMEEPIAEPVEEPIEEDVEEEVAPSRIISLPTNIDVNDIDEDEIYEDEIDEDDIDEADNDDTDDAGQMMTEVEEEPEQEIVEPEQEVEEEAIVEPVVEVAPVVEPELVVEKVEETVEKPVKKTTTAKKTTAKKTTTAKKATIKKVEQPVEEEAEEVVEKPKKKAKASSKISMEEFPFLEALGAGKPEVEENEEDASDAFLKSLDNMVSHNIKNDDE